MKWILIPTSEQLGYPPGSVDRLREVLSRLHRQRAVVKALQFAAALGKDVENHYRTVNDLLLGGVPDELRGRIAALRRAHPDDHYIFFEPWQQLLIARHANHSGSDAPDALDFESHEGRGLFLEDVGLSTT